MAIKVGRPSLGRATGSLRIGVRPSVEAHRYGIVHRYKAKHGLRREATIVNLRQYKIAGRD